MFTPKDPQKVKLIIVALTLFSILSAELALAKKSQTKGSNTSSSPKTQRVEKASAGPRIRQPSGVGRPSTRDTRAVGMNRPQSRSGISRPPAGSRRSRETFNLRSRQHSISTPKLRRNRATPNLQYSRTTLNRKPSKVTPIRSVITRRPSLPEVSKPHGSLNIKKPAAVRANIAKEVTSRANNRITWGKISQIARPITTLTPSSVSPREQPPLNSGSRINSDKASRIGTKIDSPRLPAVTSKKETTPRPGKTTSSGKTPRIARPINKPKPPTTITQKPLRDSKPKVDIAKTQGSTRKKVLRKSRVIGRSLEKSNVISRKRKTQILRVVDRISDRLATKGTAVENRRNIRNTELPKPTRNYITNRTAVVTNNRNSVLIGKTAKGGELRRAKGTSRVIYEDRPHTVKHIHHHEHVYRDHRNRLCHRIIWPRYCFPVCYTWGGCIRFRYVYPYYHRKYIFISLGGYWPLGYTYLRYYWYPCHYYHWYGYYPIAREVIGDTYNYYTYNYYYSDGTAATQYSQAADGIRPVDHNTFADVREKLAQQQAQEPEAETLADIYFESAVKAFEDGDYAVAADRFAKAMELAPEDMILPFAYVQALFANERYSEAAQVLRLALEEVSPEKEGVFYPRGLYVDEDTLTAQIDCLVERAELYPFNSDLQLLLGYQLLGIGEIQKAGESLEKASQDIENAVAATILLELVEKIRADNRDPAKREPTEDAKQ